ncbi:hypothetical protein ATCC27039_23980 [Actinomyces naeslundii]|nr:hypothetical protein ATCC27039_23980 [Actinomyces naeslundii]
MRTDPRQGIAQLPEALRAVHELAHDERRPGPVEQQQEPRHPALGKIDLTHDIETYPNSAVDVTGASYALMASWLTSFTAPRAPKALPFYPL